MQVEHKTENVTVLFVKVPELTVSFSIERLWCNFIRFKSNNSHQDIGIPKGNWQLIGLTSEVTEEQAKMMVDYLAITRSLPPVYKYQCFNNWENEFDNALDSFKSIMQHLQVYEANPYGDKELWGDVRYSPDQWKEAESRTGQWVILFKPNEK